jgi:alpha-1,2-glucosyltransferase
VLSAFSICIFPLNYFFQYLYYTDTGSTLFVLIAYHQQLIENYRISAISCAIAILFRQTNIVWLVFLLLQIVLINIQNLFSNNDAKPTSKKDLNANFLQRNRKHSNLFELLSRTPNEFFGKDFNLKNFVKKIYKEDICGKKIIFSDLAWLFKTCEIYSYFIIILSFLFFVFINNGIVVGDKSNHQASFHLCQLFYFWIFSCSFSLSNFLFNFKKIRNLFFFINKNIKLIFIFALPFICLIIHNFTYEHPFLLADNRHYTFYIWSKLFKRHKLIKYLLSFIYLSSIYLFYRNLAINGKTVGWLLSYSICLFVCLVPQKLIELRYFIIPYLIYRLNINELTLKEIIVEFLINFSINYLVIYIFLYKTFFWPNGTEIQRFMW